MPRTERCAVEERGGEREEEHDGDHRDAEAAHRRVVDGDPNERQRPRDEQCDGQLHHMQQHAQCFTRVGGGEMS